MDEDKRRDGDLNVHGGGDGDDGDDIEYVVLARELCLEGSLGGKWGLNLDIFVEGDGMPPAASKGDIGPSWEPERDRLGCVHGEEQGLALPCNSEVYEHKTNSSIQSSFMMR